MIEQLQGRQNALRGKTALITGAGGGIGLEAAKAFAWLGAIVLIAEPDRARGQRAMGALKALFPDATISFHEIDLTEEQPVRELMKELLQTHGFIDILFHNAAMIAMGNVEEVPLARWEQSYRVNFRAPLLLTQLLLPLMRERNEGTLVFVPSSGAAPYMGAYEVFKTAQAELSSTLAGELEGTGVHAYSIAPGLVKTETAMRGIETVARRMGLTSEEFYQMNDSHMLTPEEAGCGFAVSVLRAKEYHGQEIGPVQALLDCGLIREPSTASVCTEKAAPVELILKVIEVYNEQYAGWMQRNVFERQWVLRDFKKTVGLSAGQFQADLAQLEAALATAPDGGLSGYAGHFKKLRQYYERQYKLLQGFEKNPLKLRENSEIILSWIDMLNQLIE